jgi:hypothetical protein
MLKKVVATVVAVVASLIPVAAVAETWIGIAETSDGRNTSTLQIDRDSIIRQGSIRQGVFRWRLELGRSGNSLAADIPSPKFIGVVNCSNRAVVLNNQQTQAVPGTVGWYVYKAMCN